MYKLFIACLIALILSSIFFQLKSGIQSAYAYGNAAWNFYIVCDNGYNCVRLNTANGTLQPFSINHGIKEWGRR